MLAPLSFLVCVGLAHVGPALLGSGLALAATAAVPIAPRTATSPRNSAQEPAAPAVTPRTSSGPVAAAAALPATSNEQWFGRAKQFGGVEWVSRPSRDAVMGFTQPMEVEKVEVVGGQRVKVGDVLVRGREGEVVAALQVQKLRGANRAPVEAAKANLELAQIRFDAATKAQQETAMSDYEFAERRLALASAKASFANAEAEFAQEAERVKQAEESLERYRIRARFDGMIELVVAEAGQTIDIQQPVIRIVSVDPLWVDVPVSTEETIAQKLTGNSPAWVLVDVPSDKPAGEVLKGKVLYVSPVVDAAGSRRVRVEVANPLQWPAGTRARVRFSAPVAGLLPAGPSKTENAAEKPAQEQSGS